MFDCYYQKLVYNSLANDGVLAVVTINNNKTFKNKYHGVLKILAVQDKKWVHISIDFIIDFPVNRNFWGNFCINIMVMVNRLSKMVKSIFMDVPKMQLKFGNVTDRTWACQIK